MVKKLRKYPIIRDEDGLTLRKRCFELFRQGKRPAEVIKQLGAKPGTVFKYFGQWKKDPENLEYEYAVTKENMKQNSGIKAALIDYLVSRYHISEEEATERLEKPWAIKQAMRGIIKEEYDTKELQLILRAIRLVFLLQKAGCPLSKIVQGLHELMPDETQSLIDVIMEPKTGEG